MRFLAEGRLDQNSGTAAGREAPVPTVNTRLKVGPAQIGVEPDRF